MECLGEGNRCSCLSRSEWILVLGKICQNNMSRYSPHKQNGRRKLKIRGALSPGLQQNTGELYWTSSLCREPFGSPAGCLALCQYLPLP